VVQTFFFSRVYAWLGRVVEEERFRRVLMRKREMGVSLERTNIYTSIAPKQKGFAYRAMILSD
jgi:hypothetical protein